MSRYLIFFSFILWFVFLHYISDDIFFTLNRWAFSENCWIFKSIKLFIVNISGHTHTFILQPKISDYFNNPLGYLFLWVLLTKMNDFDFEFVKKKFNLISTTTTSFLNWKHFYGEFRKFPNVTTENGKWRSWSYLMAVKEINEIKKHDMFNRLQSCNQNMSNTFTLMLINFIVIKQTFMWSMMMSKHANIQ